LRDSGVRLAGGSDWNVSTYRPLHAIRQAMRRSYPEDAPEANRSRKMEVLYADQRLDIDTLLAMYTINAAYAINLDEAIGSLEVGKLADLVVLDRDIAAIPADEIDRAQVAMTIFDGRVVYRSNPRDQRQ
jgi:predicted amidohydrolase YtcJ